VIDKPIQHRLQFRLRLECGAAGDAVVATAGEGRAVVVAGQSRSSDSKPVGSVVKDSSTSPTCDPDARIATHEPSG
jgi:hypothetical protein